MEGPLDHGPVSWPALTEDELNYIWIHIDDVEPRINYRQKEMAFFREYIAYIIERDILASSDSGKILYMYFYVDCSFDMFMFALHS